MELIDIGGRRLATWCSGEGEPLVVLETGLGAPASDWGPVHERVASVTRVCHYDRANMGGSDPTETPRSARGMADDLHALIHNLSPDRPVVLVGHSFGGPICLTYAATWSAEVAGLVLVDPTHPEQFTSIGPLMPDAFGPMKEFWQTGWRSTESTAEHIDFLATFEEVRSIKDLGSLPIKVLTSSVWENLEGEDNTLDMWAGLHRDYVRMSTSGEQRVLPDRDHFLQRCAPQAVADTIKELVAEVR